MELCSHILTHWGYDKVAAILQATSSNVFPWVKYAEIDSNFTEIYSQGSNQQWSSTGSDNGFPDNEIHGANMGPTWVPSAPDGPHVDPMNLTIRIGAITWTNDNLV